MKKLISTIAFTIGLAFGVSNLIAVPASPVPFIVKQADGSEITIRLRGDEFFHYKTTLDDYTLIPDEAGILTYAELDNKGKLQSSKIKANNIERRSSKEQSFVRQLSKNISYTKQNIASRVRRSAKAITDAVPQRSYPLNGAPKSLVILVNFQDTKFIIPNSKVAFTNLLNQKGYSANGGTGSARDYFSDNSMGVFNPQFDVVGPFDLPQNMVYYGENDASLNDKNPQQMVIDACNEAFKSGVDFSQYDTDKDGLVDNVFIYYAGYNEAEHAPANTVWPHRWSLPSKNTKFNGVIVYDYACTSELRSNTGSSMCGIGTFCHEFGHVLGLPDYYATNDAKHQTLSYWNIMDGGPYLNGGRTPPSYSAFDRFFLNWAKPIELTTASNYTLENLNTSNKSYIVTQFGNHNMIGSNPNPLEFFTLENRQNVGWDSFLPGHGLLISRINFNSSAWNMNEPNNDALAMGYDIIEADGLASDNNLSGDPFPGSQNIKAYFPTLWDKTDIRKPLSNIREDGIEIINKEDRLIHFKFMNNFRIDENIHSFTTVQGTPSKEIQIVTTNGSKLKGNINISFETGTHFEIKKDTDPESSWGKTIVLVPTVDSIVNLTIIQVRYNPTVPSYTTFHEDKLIFNSGVNDYADIALTGKSSRIVYVVPPIANQASDITFSSFVAKWNSVVDATGYYLTAFNISDGVSSLTEGFDNGTTSPPNWVISPNEVSTSAIYSGAKTPSIEFSLNGDSILTEEYMLPVTKLNFYLRSMGGSNGGFVVEALNNKNRWKKVDSIQVTNTLYEKNRAYTFNESDGYLRFRFKYVKGVGSVTFDDVKVSFAKQITYLKHEEWTTETSDTLIKLAPYSEYVFKVRASDKNTVYKYENITNFSNSISTITTQYPLDKKLLVTWDKNGDVKVYLPNLEVVLYVYSTTGKLIKTITPISNTTEINDLVRKQTYILKAGTRSSIISI